MGSNGGEAIKFTPEPIADILIDADGVYHFVRFQVPPLATGLLPFRSRWYVNSYSIHTRAAINVCF